MDLKIQVDQAINIKDPSFKFYDLPVIKNLARKVALLDKSAESAQQAIAGQQDEVFNVFKAKLQSDEAMFLLYLQRLADQEDKGRGLQRVQKLRVRAIGMQAADKVLGDSVRYEEVALLDTEALVRVFSAHARELSNKPTVSVLPGGMSVVIILDSNSGDFNEKLSQAFLILNKDPSKAVILVLYPWNREQGRLVTELSNICEGLNKRKACADWFFTVNFSEGSRRPRDPRPLARWGAMIVGSARQSDWRSSNLKNDGVVNDCPLLPLEAFQ